jgi:hypothetical protein
MSDLSVRHHEKDVELARARLAQSLSTLSSPATFSAFADDLKQEAIGKKDELMDHAKSAAQSTINGFVEDLKAKAAANPAAALAIGAGLAWRLIHHPPIASALVGAGLFSLWRTNAARAPGSYKPDYLAEGKERLKEQAGEAVTKMKDIAADAQEAMSAKAADFADAAKDKVQQWRESVRETVEEVGASAKDRAETVAPEMRRAGYTAKNYVREQTQSATTMAEDLLNDPASRDKLLLGVAGVAVAAALGIACQKRLAETS